MSSSFRALAWRIAIPIIIVLVATGCFELGVSVAYDSRVRTEGLLMHLLHAISLFKVSGIDLGEPVDGPMWARYLLFLMYFAAPAVSASAIFEAVFRVARVRLRWVLYRGGHAVVIGSGRGSIDLPALIRHVYEPRAEGVWRRKQMHVVVADRSEEALLRHSGDTLKVKTDASDSGVVSLLALDRAKAVFILTDDDQANIDLYFRIRHELEQKKSASSPLVFVRVSSMDLTRALRPYNTLGRVRFFNPHIEVVRSLFTIQHAVETNEWLQEKRDDSPALDANWNRLLALSSFQPTRVVMLGFGRFGQNILLEMLTRNDGVMSSDLKSIAIISPDVENEWAHFERLMLASVGEDVCTIDPELITATHSNIAHLHTVASASTSCKTLWIVGTNSSATNLQAAAMVQRLYAMQSNECSCESMLIVRSETFSMAHDSLLSSNVVSHLTHVIVPTYHVLSMYYYRRIEEMLREGGAV